MKFRAYKNTIILLVIILSGSLCFAESTLLTDDALGEVIAQEGVCNINVSTDCNKAEKLVLVLRTKQADVDPEKMIALNSETIQNTNPGFQRNFIGGTSESVHLNEEIIYPPTLEAKLEPAQLQEVQPQSPYIWPTETYSPQNNGPLGTVVIDGQ